MKVAFIYWKFGNCINPDPVGKFLNFFDNSIGSNSENLTAIFFFDCVFDLIIYGCSTSNRK